MRGTAVTLVVAAFLLSAAATPATAVSTNPLFDDCGIDNTGNIPGCPSTFEQVDELGRGFGPDNSQFWATIENVEPGGDSKRPYVVWLYRNGFATEQEEDLDNVQWPDVNTSDPVLTALEDHSTCTLTADVASHGEFTVTTTVGDFTYNDEPTWERHAKDLMRSPVTVTASDIRIDRETGEVQCRFDMAEILNRGMEVDGRFLQWSGRKPVMGDEIGSSGSLAIKYSVGDLQTQQQQEPVSGTVHVDGGNITVKQVGEKKEGAGWFESAISGIMDVVGGDGITAAILRGIAGIFMEFIRTVHEFVWTLLTWTPNVTGNPAVTQIHTLSLTVASLLAVLVLMAGGILHMTGPIAGVSYTDIRLILPRVIAALAFGAVSLPLLQYGVELTRVLTQVFMPFSSMDVAGYLSYSAAAILVYIVDAVLLLVLVLIFMVRGAYILFGAAISPLLALGWAFPYTSRASNQFIAAWWAALAIAPLDVLVLRFIITLPQAGGDLAGTLGNWVYALAASFILIAIPYQLYGASKTVAGTATGAGYSMRQTFHRHGGYTRVAERIGHGEELARELDGRYHRRLEERTPDHDRGFGRSPRRHP